MEYVTKKSVPGVTKKGYCHKGIYRCFLILLFIYVSILCFLFFTRVTVVGSILNCIVPRCSITVYNSNVRWKQYGILSNPHYIIYNIHWHRVTLHYIHLFLRSLMAFQVIFIIIYISMIVSIIFIILKYVLFLAWWISKHVTMWSIILSNSKRFHDCVISIDETIVYMAFFTMYLPWTLLIFLMMLYYLTVSLHSIWYILGFTF